jgi:hypothetical protein
MPRGQQRYIDIRLIHGRQRHRSVGYFLLTRLTGPA